MDGVIDQLRKHGISDLKDFITNEEYDSDSLIEDIADGTNSNLTNYLNNSATTTHTNINVKSNNITYT